MESYTDLISAFLPTARAGAVATAQWAAQHFPGRNASLLQCVQNATQAIHFPSGLGPFGMPSGGNGPSPGGDWGLRWSGLYAVMPLIWKYECVQPVVPPPPPPCSL